MFVVGAVFLFFVLSLESFFSLLTTSVPGMWQTDMFCLFLSFVWILDETYPPGNWPWNYRTLTFFYMRYPPKKPANTTMENQPFKDVSPIENGEGYIFIHGLFFHCHCRCLFDTNLCIPIPSQHFFWKLQRMDGV